MALADGQKVVIPMRYVASAGTAEGKPYLCGVDEVLDSISGAYVAQGDRVTITADQHKAVIRVLTRLSRVLREMNTCYWASTE